MEKIHGDCTPWLAISVGPVLFKSSIITYYLIVTTTVMEHIKVIYCNLGEKIKVKSVLLLYSYTTATSALPDINARA